MALATSTVQRLMSDATEQAGSSTKPVMKLPALNDALTAQRQAIDAKSVTGGAAIQ